MSFIDEANSFYKKLGIKIEKKDEHTWIARKENE